MLAALCALTGCAASPTHTTITAPPVVYEPTPVDPDRALAAELDASAGPGEYLVRVEQDGRLVLPDAGRVVHLQRKPFTMVYVLLGSDTNVSTGFDAKASAYDALRRRDGKVPPVLKHEPLLGGPAQGFAESRQREPNIFLHNGDDREGYHYWSRDSGRFDAVHAIVTEGRPTRFVARRRVETFTPLEPREQRKDRTPLAAYPADRLYVIVYANTETPCLYTEPDNPDAKPFTVGVHPAMMDQCFIIEFAGPPAR